MGPGNAKDSLRDLKPEYLSYLATISLGLVLAITSAGRLGSEPLSGTVVLVLYTGFVFFLGISFTFHLKRVRRLIR